ncbi:MAG: DUF4382 domain-containing protein [bacterium]|nr:DUF4382 domain-containing protein [bacterium]
MSSKLLALVVTLTALVFLSSCNGTDPNDEPRLVMETEVSSNTVTVAGEQSDPSVDGFRVIDSLRVNRTRILISRIKLHTAEDGEDDNKGKDVKVGPAVIDFTRNKVSTIFSTPIPVGRYEKIKLEMHKFNSNEALTYRSDATFGPFAEPERITLIVDGTLYVNGVPEDFTWTDDQTSNLWIKFEPYIEVTASSTTNVVLNFDPVFAFRFGGKLLDPKDVNLKGQLRDRFWGALKLRRK